MVALGLNSLGIGLIFAPPAPKHDEGDDRDQGHKYQDHPAKAKIYHGVIVSSIIVGGVIVPGRAARF